MRFVDLIESFMSDRTHNLGPQEWRKSDSLLEASLIWQTRALQLEQRLKEIEAGPIAPPVVSDIHEHAPQVPLLPRA